MKSNSNNNSTKRTRARKAVSIAFDVILYVFLALCVFALIMSAVSSKNNGAADIFGYEMRIVVSDSMASSEYSKPVSQYRIKDIKVGSMVFIERVPEDEQQAKAWYDGLQVGDVLTFAYVTATTQDVITHRITNIDPTDNGYVIRLEGDNRAKEDGEVSYQTIYTSPLDYPDSNQRFNYVIGKVVGQSVVLGYIVYGVTQPIGLALIVIVPCALIMIWQIVRIVNVVNEDRKRKSAEKVAQAEQLVSEQAEQARQQAEELEQLKRKIAELEQVSKRDGESGDDK